MGTSGQDTRIGFIGLGVMGQSMAKNLLNAGHPLSVYSRRKESAAGLIEQGADWCTSPGKVGEKTSVVITMVGYPEDVRQVYFGDDGIFTSLNENTLLIDMTTSDPFLAKEIAQEATNHSCQALDAPVSGGDIGAREGRLSIMVGGDSQAYAKALPVFQILGKNIVYQGGAGAGQFTKMSNQIAIASGMIGVCEALYYAKKSGLDPVQVLASISAGAAGSWSLTNLAPRILAQDYDPGFYVKHFIKDMEIALNSAHQLGMNVPGLELALKLYRKLVSLGMENSGTQGLYYIYEKELLDP